MTRRQKGSTWRSAYFWLILMSFILIVPHAICADILYVVGRNNLMSSDKAVVHHLEARGFNVVIKTDEAVQCDDASAKDLVIISESVLALKMGSKFCDVPVPLLCSEPWLFDDLGMTGDTAFTDFGRKKRQKHIVLTDEPNPLRAELSGEVQVSEKCFFLGWGCPGKNAIRVAELEEDPNKCPVFAYESGAAMPGKIAPARRIGFFMFKNTAKTLTAEGWALYDAAVDWAIGVKSADL